ncbi:TPA: hypothetical protein I8271_002064 [Kluyvera intermedia]|uniref:tRNA_anti-like n=2 Tax=Enterobacteriaceae TaxID=543 RepID=A0AAC8TL87_9ENTR|nr:hypothetical protein [Phytobacter ursingii]HAT2205012.1 hypothetical protein [Kluyvera intermedia]AKL11135.1 hypothetical protein AB182_07350 [Phytobacter ursingii]HAT2515573.1 hypothetical protein [Kluyvera intermedia]HAT2603330.1 hypothetical protein [Kluyvera intermedia]HAT2680317.1 hypothetical protein [Kluyvera intermedia]
MKSPYDGYIKKSLVTVVIAYGIYLLYGLATTSYQIKTPEIMTSENTGTVFLQEPEQPSKPSLIDILPRLYTTEDVYWRFKEHEFRATNNFKGCRLMVTGQVKSIGTTTFSKAPLVTLYIRDSSDGLKFIFENTDYDNDKVAALNVGDTLIISGWNARPATFGGIFLDSSQIMTNMVSKKKRQMLVVNGGIYDREICQK